MVDGEFIMVRGQRNDQSYEKILPRYTDSAVIEAFLIHRRKP